MLHDGSTVSPFVAIVGPTGSGKSGLGIALAEELAGEIVNCDSVQVYRGFNIGAAKIRADEQRGIPHHLLDVFDWNEDCDAHRFAVLAKRAINDIAKRGKVPIVVGGTGLYLRSVWGYGWDNALTGDPQVRLALGEMDTETAYAQLQSRDPVRAAQIHANDRFRILRALEIIRISGRPASEQLRGTAPQSPPAFAIFLNPDRKQLHEVLARRVDAMLAEGLVGEVEGLLAQGVSTNAKPMGSIGYRQVLEFLQGEIPKEELKERILVATRQYAKRQVTWFRSMKWDEEVADFGSSLARNSGSIVARIRAALNDVQVRAGL
jgi:tRNA dimethylallyltransferase